MKKILLIVLFLLLGASSVFIFAHSIAQKAEAKDCACNRDCNGNAPDVWCSKNNCGSNQNGICEECRNPGTQSDCNANQTCRVNANGKNVCVNNPPQPPPPPPPPLYQTSCVSGAVQVIIMIDLSLSMRGDLRQAKDAAHHLVNILGQDPNNAIGLAAFDYNTKTSGTHGLMQGWWYDTGWQEIHDTIENLSINKNQPIGTCIECGMLDTRDYFQFAIDNGMFPGMRRVAIVLSDGDANRWVTPNERWVVDGGGPAGSNFERGRRQAYNQAVAMRSNMGVEFWTLGFPGADNNDGEKFMHDLAYNLGVEAYYQSGPSGWYNYFGHYASYLLGGAVSGVVWNDFDRNGINNGETVRGYQQLQLLNAYRQAVKTSYSDANGNYVFSGLSSACGGGNYFIRPILPDPQWRVSYPGSGEHFVANPALGVTTPGYNFGVYRIPNTVGTITGAVFRDNNIDGRYTPITDQLFTGPGTITTSVGTRNITNGSYSYQNIPVNAAGSRYNLTLQVPTTFRFTFPFNGAYSAGIFSDGTCTASPSNGLWSCYNAVISNLNFGITDIFPWIQTVDSHIRNDQISVRNIIPAATSLCGNVTIRNGAAGSAGIVFSSSGTPTFGTGRASAANWIVTGSTTRYVSPVSGTDLRTSYDATLRTLSQNKITPTQLPCTTCTINNSTLQSTAYRTTGDVTLGTVDITDKKVVILVGGNLTITNTINVAPGGFLMFVVRGNIFVSPSLGAATPACPSASAAQVEGVFSTDNDFILQGTNNCFFGADPQLRMEGSIITNADQSGTGSFVNNRSLCGNDRFYPVFSIAPRGDFLLNAPSYMMRTGFNWQEAAP